MAFSKPYDATQDGDRKDREGDNSNDHSGVISSRWTAILQYFAVINVNLIGYSTILFGAWPSARQVGFKAITGSKNYQLGFKTCLHFISYYILQVSANSSSISHLLPSSGQSIKMADTGIKKPQTMNRSFMMKFRKSTVMLCFCKRSTLHCCV